MRKIRPFSFYIGFMVFLSEFLPVSQASAQEHVAWKQVDSAEIQSQTTNPFPDRYLIYQIDWSSYSQPLYADTSTITPIRLTLPTPEGWTTFQIVATSLLSKQTQQNFPDIRTFKGTATDQPSVAVRITISSQGLNASILNGSNSYLISPACKNTPNYYFVYYRKNAPNHQHGVVQCGVSEEEMDASIKRQAQRRPAGVFSIGDCQLRTYRLAVAATDEYTASSGSISNAMANITATVNDINAIYERDAAIHFELVTTAAIIYNTGGSDPYPTQAGPNSSYLQVNTNNLNSVLGASNYDVGIVFNSDPAWGGGYQGLAIVGGACDLLYKGSAAIGGALYTGSIFADGAAHEIGHLFSATHTFVANNGQCSGNVAAATAYEPGGGSTVMAYAGTCTGNYYQFNDDPYFHAGSLEQIVPFAISSATCAAVTPLTNHAPVVTTTGNTYTIPVSTPFQLTASATDTDNDAVTYTWEEMDPGTATSLPPDASATTGPDFRSYSPSISGTRYFPNMAALATGAATPYEVLPSVARTMNFRVTARDNAAGGGCSDEKDVTVNTSASAGPFQVTSQSTPTALTADGINTFTVTWNVAGTDGVPVNCSNVNILYSIDGGLTYPYTIVSNVANNGSATLLVPNIPSCNGRIMVAAANNIFYNINAAPVSITSSCSANGSALTPNNIASYPAGSPSLALSVAPEYGALLSMPITGSLSASDPATGLVEADGGACDYFGGNATNYKSYSFKVSKAGTYTFNVPGASGSLYPVLTLYQGDYTPLSAACTNFLNATYVHSFGSTAFNEDLCPGLNYTLVITGFNASSTNGNYSITVTPPAGGGLYTGTPSPGAGFSYAYVIVNNATGNIVAITSGTDLSDSNTYSEGQYTIYGLSYTTGTNLSPYIGGLYTALTVAAQNSVICANFSTNNKPVIVTAASVLPVGLLSFTGSLANHHAVLTWSTSSEHNNKGFEVLKSTDGISFDNIGFVTGAGNSTQERDYTFTDPVTAQSVQYYKINEVDVDNNKHGSSTILLKDPDASVFIERIHTQDNSNILYINAGNMNSTIAGITIKLVNSLGQVVKEVKTPYGDQSIDITALSPGVYFIQVIDDHFKQYYSNKVLHY